MTTREELIAAIGEDFEDDAPWMLFADFLQGSGDPLGELIALDLALERGEQQEKLLVARAALIAKHGAAILGDSLSRFIADGYATVTWNRGFIDAFTYEGRSYNRRAIGWLLKLIAEKPEPFTFIKHFAFPNTDLADLAFFTRFKHIEELDFPNTNVTNIDPLLEMPKLVRVNFSACDVAFDRKRALEKRKPDLRIAS